MKVSPYSFTLAAACLLVLASCTPDAKAPKRYTASQFYDVEAISGGAFSPDESRILISSRRTGIFNAFEIDIATGEARQLTSSTEDAIFTYGYFPSDNRVLYGSDHGGDEITHLFVRSPEGGVRDLIQDSTAKAEFAGWSYDKKLLYYLSNSRDKRFFDMYKVQVGQAAGESDVYPAELLYTNAEGLDPAAISNDDRYVALVKSITTNNSDMYLLDTQSGETKLLSQHTGDVQYAPQYFSLDGGTLYYLTDEGSEFRYLASYNLRTGDHSKVEEAPWDVQFAYISRTGKYRVVGINNDARTEMKIYDESSGGKLVEMPGLPPGDITNVNIADSEKLMSFYLSSSKSPANLYVYNFETREAKRLTNTMNPEIEEQDLVAGEVVRFKSFDGMEIPCLLYTPKGLASGQKVPAMLLIHGGPGGQTRLTFSSMTQHLVNNGYVVLAVNNRGSSGYGKSFYAADDRRHGVDDLRDCVESKKLLTSLPYVDPDRIGIMGGSYGGYMVMAALAFQPEEFKVGVNIFGVTNWLRTLRSIPSWWESFRNALYTELGDPSTADSVMLYDKSPLFHAAKITKPFLVLQGKNDPRVLQAESDEIVAAAKANGVPVEYVLFTDEGHGFTSKENSIRTSDEIVRFLDKYLKNEPPPRPAN